MKRQSKKNNNRKRIKYSRKKQRGGLFGFGKKPKTNPKQKFREVLDATHIKILEYRVKIQINNHQKILKLTTDILTLEPINYKPHIDKIINLSTTKTNNYKTYSSTKSWKKLISKSEEDIIKQLALKQIEQFKDSYTDTSKSVNYLSDNLVKQFINQSNQTRKIN
jgi:hypothetical protein